jgi:DNA/RNA-binding domain of Phe-tRNA-synthetase-like protein
LPKGALHAEIPDPNVPSGNSPDRPNYLNNSKTMQHTISVQPAIFQQQPTFTRGLVIAQGIQNAPLSPELEALLPAAIANAQANPINLETDPRILDWNEAHRKFNSNPNKFMPAHRALLKRVQKSGASLPFINSVVAIMNYNSISAALPVGGDDLQNAGSHLELRLAVGNEAFIPLGCPEDLEHPEPGEIIYVLSESNEVMCRRWNWRNGNKTAITEMTNMMVMNIDAIGLDSEKRAIETRDRVANMLQKFCGADVEVALISSSNPVHRFSL